MLDEDDPYEYERERAQELVAAAAGGEPATVRELLHAVWFAYEVPHDDGFTGIAVAAPHLVELLDVPGVDRVPVLTVLTEVAEQPVDPGPGDGPDRDRVAGLTAAQDTVAAAAATYRRLLGDDDADVRAWAGTLLGRVAGDDPDVVEALRRRGRTDPSPVVRASLIVALAGLGVPVADRLDDPAPLPRFAAALTGAATPADLRRGLSAEVPGFAEVPRMPNPPGSSATGSPAGPTSRSTDWRSC